MPDQQASTKLWPFGSTGLVTRLDSGLLDETQFADYRNVSCPQEGSLGPVAGNKKYSNSYNLGAVHSLAKLALGGADSADPRYTGDGTRISRVTGPYTSFTDISSGRNILGSRWEASPFGVGSSSRPRILIAHLGENLQDNGSWSKLRPWGVKAPHRPPTCTLADPAMTSFPGLKSLATHDAGNSRLSTTVSSATLIGGSYYQIFPASMVDIQAGMLIKLGAGGGSSPSGYVLADTVDATSFFAYCYTTPSGTVTAFNTTVPSPIADGGTYTLSVTGSTDWSFQGDPKLGYDSDDLVHFGLNISDLTAVSEIRLRIMSGASAVDYYEQVYDTAALAAFGTGSWLELTVAKSAFTKVGGIGNGGLTWKNITRIDVVVVSAALAGTPAFSVKVGALFAAGGQGSDSESIATAQPYEYCYTARDPETGAEGNPTPAFIERDLIHVQNRAIAVTYYGIDTDAATGNPNLTGYGSIAIYRRGGVFTDAEWRFVGYGTNQGVSGGTPVAAASPFIDNFRDSEISGNRTVEFDNYPPVPSDLPIKFAATLAAGYSNHSYVNLNCTGFIGQGTTPLTDYMSVGSVITVGNGSNAEQCVVISVSSNPASPLISVWIQADHFTGEQVECTVFAGRGVDLICQAGESILVAGDTNNPDIVYRSKAGRPDAFPVINLATGNEHRLRVGTPSNPIHGIVEYNGEFVVLNKTSISTFQIWQGRMANPKKTPANRGMVAKHLFVKAGNAIWYLSYDGIYAWAGGEETKMTEAIDGIFTDLNQNGIPPLDRAQYASCWFEYFNNAVYFGYKDTGGNQYILRYSTIYKRWERLIANLAAGVVFGAMMAELDTGRLVCGIYDNGAGKAFLHEMNNGISQGWTGTPGDGADIEWLAKTGWFAAGSRITQKLFQTLYVELENPNDSVTVKVYYDYSATADATDTFVIAAAAGRRHVPLPLQQGGGVTTGKEAAVAALEFSGSSNSAITLFSAGFTATPLADIQRGKVTDWMSLSHPYDKRLYALHLEYDAKGASITLNLDTITGVAGATVNLGVQSFTLSGSGRTKVTLPIIDGQVVKMARLRPSVPTSNFLIFTAEFIQENYPPDIVYFSEYVDKGTPYDKYIQQIVFDVNTNGQAVTVALEVDGAVAQTLPTITSTLATRSQVLTLNPAVIGKRIRIRVTNVPAGGMWQLWGVDYVVQPADRGPVSHTEDWSDGGHPFDKHLRTCTIEYDNSGGTVQVLVDTLTGINGTVQNSAALSFTLSGTGRSKHTFPIPDGFIVKMTRIRPNTTSSTFKMWSAKFDFTPFPADIIYHNEWSNFEYEHDKILQELALDIDTGGVACAIAVQSDTGGTLQTYNVTTTVNARGSIVTLNPSLTGKQFRLLMTPGANGKAQLFGMKPKFLKLDPGPVEHSFSWDDLDHPYDKRLTEVTFEYENSGGTIQMVVDTVTGIDGTTQNLQALTFTLSGTIGRSKQTFAIPDGYVVKMVRVKPFSTAPTFRIWRYVFAKNPYPPDKVAVTEWSDYAWACEKIARGVTLDIDTGGVACTVEAQADGVTQETFSVTTTTLDRVRIISFGQADNERIGKLWRLKFTPHASGKAQIFNHEFEFVREPCYKTHMDTLEFVLGSAGWKMLKQCWLEYVCLGQITVTIYRDGVSQIFYQVTLPAQAKRNVERFKFPKISNGKLNKSKAYRMTIDAVETSKPFKLYRDSSRIESKAFGGDQRAGYNQNYVWQAMQPAV